jgi:putative two-component system response regulator
LSAAEAAVVAFAATVHDVGMTLVDQRLLEASGPLTREQLERVRQHVALGDEVLGRLESVGTETFDRLHTMGAVREIVLSHHEWWDGSGYPRGLRGSAIPVGARVLAVVDAYESLTTGRAHRPAQTPDEAVEVIQRLRGTQFDPDVVMALQRMLRRQDAGSRDAAAVSAASDTRR